MLPALMNRSRDPKIRIISMRFLGALCFCATAKGKGAGMGIGIGAVDVINGFHVAHDKC